MSMNLDKRQRAMLREMGVRVWQPLAPLAEAPPAIEVIAASASAESARGQFDSQIEDAKAAVAPALKRDAAPVPDARPPAVSSPDAEPSSPSAPSGRQASWHLGQAQALYGETAQAGGGRWLVLAETPASALQGPVFEGDAGRLLDNMLRAARLNRADAVLYAPLVRQGTSRLIDELSAALSALIERARPDQAFNRRPPPACNSRNDASAIPKIGDCLDGCACLRSDKP
ncbi:MAG: hypothetical protein ABIQ90_03785, partial [Polaromonas sp.]